MLSRRPGFPIDRMGSRDSSVAVAGGVDGDTGGGFGVMAELPDDVAQVRSP